MSFVAGHCSFQLLSLSLSTDWKPAGDYALMSCIYAELNISFGTTEERTGNQNSKLEYVSLFFTQNKKKKRGETIIDILGRGTLGRPGGVFRPDPRRGGGRKAAAFSFCVVYDPCCWLTASPNWLAAVMYFNNVRMLDGYSVTSKRCWIELPTPRLALFFFFFLSPWSWIFNKKWFLMKLIILI